MTESEAIRDPVRRTALGPVVVTGVLVVLSLAATALSHVTVLPKVMALSGAAGPSIIGAGWVLAWLLIGLTAGYALSGSV